MNSSNEDYADCGNRIRGFEKLDIKEFKNEDRSKENRDTSTEDKS